MFHNRITVTPAIKSVAALGLAAANLGVLTSTAAAASPSDPAVGKPIPGRYIVAVKEGHDPRGIARSVQARLEHVYDTALTGFAAELNAGQLNALRRSAAVERVEQDAVVSAAGTQSMDVNGEPWGLDRIDQTSLPLSRTYSTLRTGSGVRAYIIDSGLEDGHPEFGGRAMTVKNATTGQLSDCNGHGTHVAGTVGGKTYGVAKDALLRGVKVLDCSGYGSWADFIAGVDWVAANHIKPAVANISIQGGALMSANVAVHNLVQAGVFVAVAAGNDNVDACNISPASTGQAYTVAASTQFDSKWSASNWGICVDGYAPGASVKSAALGGGAKWESGTSMASPHVAGVGALLCSWGATYCTPSYITNWLSSSATTGKIAGNPSNTPNRLLNKHSL